MKKHNLSTASENWQRVKLSEAFRFTQKPRGLRFSDFEHIPFVPMELVPIGGLFFDQFEMRAGDDISSGTYFEPGDVLLAKITPSFENGKQGIIEKLPIGFGVATTEVIPIAEIPGVSDRFYLFYYLLRSVIRSELAGKMEGTTGRQRLNRGVLENLRIPLPPLPEQRAIARVLRAAQAAREARQREASLERERKAALMDHLFTHGTRGEPTKQTPIGEMPESWEVKTLGDVAEFLQYGTSRECMTQPIGVPVLRIPNVVGGKVDIADLKYLELDRGEAEGLRLAVGDILFVRTNGRREYTGRCAVYMGEPEKALFASYLIRLRLKTDSIVPKFVQLYATTPKGSSYLAGRASNAADGKFNINTQTIKSVLVPQPPLAEQDEIVDGINACDAKIAALDRESALLDELFRALLEELMSGRVVVKRLVNGSSSNV